LAAAQLLRSAIDRYAFRNRDIPPGTFDAHTSGRAHQISRANATAASAPPDCFPSPHKTRISCNKSSRGIPNSVPTRESCKGATAMPRLAKIGATQRASRVQNPHSASKNNHPRARRPFPSVNSEASDIIPAASSPNRSPNT
jgi:hypothetical protein